MAIDFRADRSGLKQLLRGSTFAGEINALAEQIASNLRAQGLAVDHERVALPVVVDRYTTDRTAASVTIAHPAGLAVQAKHGALTKAAAEAGLEVKER